MGESQDPTFDILVNLEMQVLHLKKLQGLPDTMLDKRALSIAITHLETAQLWLANSRPD